MFATLAIRLCGRLGPTFARNRLAAWLLVIGSVLAATLFNTTAFGAPLKPSEQEQIARRSLASKLGGARLVWERGGRLYHSGFAPFAERTVPSLPGAAYRPRWSKDGTQVVFQLGDNRIAIMDADFKSHRVLFEGAHTPDWSGDGRSITAISDSGYQVVRIDPKTTASQVIYDARRAPWNGQALSQSAVLHPNNRYLLTFRLTPEHASEIIDLREKRYIRNPGMQRGDCNPMWDRSGLFVLSTARTANRPVVRAAFDPVKASVMNSSTYVELGRGLRYMMHEPIMSNDNQWLVFAGVVQLGFGRDGRHEIYVWRDGDQHPPVRLTFDTEKDSTPSLFVPSPN